MKLIWTWKFRTNRACEGTGSCW